MSAIAGMIQLNFEPVPVDHGAAMMNALQIYPADVVRTWHKDSVFLGCRHQRITPESVREELPYFDDASGLAITSDAIIDNRDELFGRLCVDLPRRSLMTDSELILLAYDKWGEEAPAYLVGDFAFIIWDEKRHKLFGARDFSGGRTLYFHHTRNRFAFCSTIGPLFTLSDVEKELNEQWLAEFLAISGMADVVDGSLTAYKNIEQIPPAHSISVVDYRVTLSRYCKLSSEERLRLNSNEEYVEAFQDVFREAVSARLRTHRQVGAQLSGGLDSGAIVSFAAHVLRPHNKPLHTFSYIPPKDFADFTPKQWMPDERPFIRSTVQHVGGITDHYLDFQGRDSYSEIDNFLTMLEMPYKFFENSFWMKGIFQKAHEEGVGVLLNGGRGNLSISWGAAIPYYGELLKKLRWSKLLREIRLYSLNIGSGRKRVLTNVGRAAFPFLRRFRSAREPFRLPAIISSEFATRTKVYEKLSDHGLDQNGWVSGSNVYEHRKRHFEEVFHWNASNTLSAKMSLRYPLWKRDPTNDIRVIRFCLSLPIEQYVQNGMDRALIRRATESLLPDNVRLNQRIRGVQGADWLHRMLPHWPSFIEEVERIEKDHAFFEFVDGQVYRKALSKIRQGAIPEQAVDPDFKVMMRCLIVYRFMKHFL